MDPARLADLEEIKQLKARYFRLLDTKQWKEFGDVFTDDCALANGPIEDGVVIGRDEIVAYVKRGVERLNTVHHGHMSQIEITSSTTATATWSMEDMLWWPPERGGQKIWGMGWYFEEYRKEADGEWRILDLKLRRIRVEVNGKQQFPPPA